MKKGLVGATAAAVLCSGMLLPARAEEPDMVDDPVGEAGYAAEVGQAYVGYWANLVGPMVPTSWVPSDPVADAADAAEGGQAYAGWYVGQAVGQHYGGGAFTGAVVYDDPPSVPDGCAVDAEHRRAVLSITAHVAFSNGTTRYTGPLVISGTGCNARTTGSMTPTWAASGTDPSGNTLRCPRLGGLVTSASAWSAMIFGQDCTLNGVVLPKVQMLLKGRHVSDGGSAGVLSGALWMNSY